jgi:hypothetical protein
MSVLMPDGSYAVAQDGTVLDSLASPDQSYVIRATQYGRYSVQYVSRDLNGNEAIYSYIFTVVDREPPVVTLKDGAITATVGSTVIVKEAVVEDNYTSCTTLINVKLPSGKFISLTGNSFVATVAGTYRVYYFVTDESGNVTTVSYSITVE